MKRQVFISLALAIKPKYLLLENLFEDLDANYFDLANKILDEYYLQDDVITESDVLLASASNAIIYGFNVRPDAAVRQKAEEEKAEEKTEKKAKAEKTEKIAPTETTGGLF